MYRRVYGGCIVLDRESSAGVDVGLIVVSAARFGAFRHPLVQSSAHDAHPPHRVVGDD